MRNKSVFMFFGSVVAVLIVMGALIFWGLSSFQSMQNDVMRFELIDHGNNIVVFDRKTGDYWTKYMATNEGSNDWTKVESPVE